MTRLAFLWGLQPRLIGAFIVIVVVALALSALVFVLVRRGDQEQRALDRVAAASPAVYAEFLALQLRSGDATSLDDFANGIASTHRVRLLLVDAEGIVEVDSGRNLVGEHLDLLVPGSTEAGLPGGGPRQRYRSWRPPNGTPGHDLVLLQSTLPALRLSGAGSVPAPGRPLEASYSLVLAVPNETVTRAWLDLMPGLALAGAITLPAAIVLAVLLANYITRPLHRLTVATRDVAAGAVQIDVDVHRRDEVGRLAASFSDMARRVGEAREQQRQLVADVSHDLKTPLTSVLGFSQALRDGQATDTAAARHLGGIIYDEAARLDARLRDLLLLSELDTGHALIDPVEVDLGALVQGVATRLGPALATRRLLLVADLQPGVVVHADQAKIERAIENLVDNARKHAPEGSEVRLSSGLDAVAAGFAVVEVANAAPALGAEELPRLFDRFYRRDAARGANGGSGLGLPIARDLVQLHGGTLTARLEGDQVVFTARIPVEPPGG